MSQMHSSDGWKSEEVYFDYRTGNPPKQIKRAHRLFPSGWILIILVFIGLNQAMKFREYWAAPMGPGIELSGEATAPGSASGLNWGAKLLQVLKAGTTTGSVNSNTTVNSPTYSANPKNDSPASSAPIPTSKPLCGGPPMMTILAVGTDSRGDTYLYGLADVIRIVRVDFITPKVAVLALPRDLWVNIPGISDHYGITQGKLNQAYLFGGKGYGYYDGPGEGPGLLARTLDLNFGLQVEHYGSVTMQTFADMVDSIGGIDVSLPTAVDATQTGELDNASQGITGFPAGQIHLSGSEALLLARIRMPYSDLTRIDNQTIVLQAIRDKLLNAAMLPKLPKMINTFQGSALTDLSRQQIEQLVCLLPNIKYNNLVFTSLPDETMKLGKAYDPFRKTTTSILEVDNAVIRQFIQQFMTDVEPIEAYRPENP